MAQVDLMFYERFVKTFLLISVCAALSSSAKEPTGAVISDDTLISVDLSLNGRSTVRSGDVLTFSVTIKNNGSRDVFIPIGLDAVNQRLVMYLQVGSSLEGPLTHVVADSFVDRVKPFASLLVENWILLKPGYRYGTQAIMDAHNYPALNVPGKYRIKAIYRSSGLRGSPESNPLRGWETEIEKLPFKAWEGQVETKSIWVTVLSPQHK